MFKVNSLFSECTLYINDYRVSGDVSNYAYKSYIQTLLCNEQHKKQSELNLAGYFPDVKNHDDWNDNYANNVSNLWLSVHDRQTRAEYFRKGATSSLRA